MHSFFRKLVSPPKERPSVSTGMNIFFAGAAFFALPFILLVWPDIVVDLYWVNCPCVVLDGRVTRSSSSDEATYRAEIQIRYEYEGKTSEIWSTHVNGGYSSGEDDAVEEIQRFPPGKSYTCWVNPDNPAQAVILRGLRREALSLLFPLIFIVAGIRSLYYAFTLRNKSREQIRQSSQGGPTTCIPSAPTEPGAHLPFRLHHEKDIGGNILFLFLALFFSFFEVVLLVAMVSSNVGGVGALVLLFFIVVVGLLALLLWLEIIKNARIALRIPPTILEISALPVRPGAPFDLYIEQPKPFQFSTFAVNLVCEEAATNDRDSDSSTTEKRDVYEQSILASQQLAAEAHQPFVHRTRIVLPANAMHSLDAPHNKITWKLVISGNSTTGIDFRRDVPIVVHPPKLERATGYRDTHTS